MLQEHQVVIFPTTHWYVHVQNSVQGAVAPTWACQQCDYSVYTDLGGREKVFLHRHVICIIPSVVATDTELFELHVLLLLIKCTSLPTPAIELPVLMGMSLQKEV